MGRMLGYHDSDELDRPDLNKCPDCGCYFAQTHCPLCDKLCPEEMRAGNRAAPKRQKRRSNSAGRVQFIPWYHSCWFILIMLYFMLPVGIVLFLTSPYSKKTKIIAVAAVVGVYALLFVLGPRLLTHLYDKPLVNDDISREEYVQRCEPMDVKTFYRISGDTGRYISMELTVIEKCVEQSEDVYDVGATYYRCRDISGGDLIIYVQDCNLGSPLQFLPEDVIRVYGESAGTLSFWQSTTYTEALPCLYMAYCELIG